jgi:FkbM family methyltransferase
MKSKIVRIWNRLRFGKFVNLKVHTKINERTFAIPLIRGIGAGHFVNPEPWLSIAIKKLMTSMKGKFVDVGVNVGQTLLKVKSIDPDMDYVGFEPNPTCLFYLNELCKQNALKNVVIVPCGLGNRTFIADLTLYTDQADSSATIIAGFRNTPGRTIKVPIIDAASASQIFSETIGMIKIDVEGAELDVLQGLKDVISKQRPFIICEILPVYDASNTDRLQRQNNIAVLLKAVRYSIYRIRENATLQPLSGFEVHSNLADVNYLFVPDENAVAVGENW